MASPFVAAAQVIKNGLIQHDAGTDGGDHHIEIHLVLYVFIDPVHGRRAGVRTGLGKIVQTVAGAVGDINIALHLAQVGHRAVHLGSGVGEGSGAIAGAAETGMGVAATGSGMASAATVSPTIWLLRMP